MVFGLFSKPSRGKKSVRASAVAAKRAMGRAKRASSRKSKDTKCEFC